MNIGKSRFYFIFVIFLFQFSILNAGVLVPQSVQPAANSNDTLSTQVQAVSIEYNEAPDASSVSTGTFFVHGSMTGQLLQTLSVSSNDVILTPDFSFFPGEVVSVSATTGILSQSTSEGATTPTVWQFEARTNPSSGNYILTPFNVTPGGTTFGYNGISAIPGDFNADGFVDIAGVYYISSSSSIVYYLENNNGQDLVQAYSIFVPSGLVSGLVPGDFDRDGDLDLIISANGTGQTVSLHWNDGSGVFTDSGLSINPGISTNLTNAEDLDGDGDLDISLLLTNNTIEFWFNDGVGNFSLNQSIALGATIAGGDGDMADYDNDGDLDYFVGLFDISEPGTDLQIYLNDGVGNFTTGPQILNQDDNVYALRAVDINNDQFPDLVYARQGSGTSITIQLNNGAGVYSNTQTIALDPAGNSGSPSLGDINGDGFIDMYLSQALFSSLSSSPGDRIYFNDGSGTMVDSGQRLGSHASVQAGLFDFDNDNDLDAYVPVSDPLFGIDGTDSQLWLNDEPEVPVIVENSALTVDQGTSILVTSNNLEVTDADTSSNQIIFTITQFPNGGNLFNDSTLLDSGNNTFTQADLDANLISYTHLNGSGTTDSFSFTYSDGSYTRGPESFNFFIAPIFTLNDLSLNSMFISDNTQVLHLNVSTGLRSLISSESRGLTDSVEDQFYGIFAETNSSLVMNTILDSTNEAGVMRVDLITGDRTLLFDYTVDSIALRPIGLHGDGNGNFYHISPRISPSVPRLACFNPALDQVQIIASDTIGTGFNVVGNDVAVESDGSILYVVYSINQLSETGLYRVDPSTGNRTQITNFNNGGSSFLTGLEAVDVMTSGSILVLGSDDGIDVVWEVDPVTGNTRVVTFQSQSGVFLSDMAIHPTTDEIYFAGNYPSSGFSGPVKSIVHVDYVSGTQTVVASTGQPGDEVGSGVDFADNFNTVYIEFPSSFFDSIDVSTSVDFKWEFYQ